LLALLLLVLLGLSVQEATKSPVASAGSEVSTLLTLSLDLGVALLRLLLSLLSLLLLL
jgi:hypothetical protein